MEYVFKNKLKTALVFLFIFFCVGFTLGTLTLSIIVENVAAYVRRSEYMYSYESPIIIAIIVIYVFYSFLFAKWLTKYYLHLKTSGKLILLLILAALTGISLWYWLHPKTSSSSENLITTEDKRFIAGPYPDRAAMIGLKNQGYTAIISLLSPYVLPFEPILLDKEKKTAREIGIPVIEIPMLPWVTKNTDSINKIIALAKANNTNKYYVHCYYGRDRVSMFMRIVNQYAPVSTLNQHDQDNQVSTSQDNSVTYIDFERGTAIEIGKRIVFAPTPTEDEFLKFIVAVKNPFFGTTIRSVISIQSDPGAISAEEQSLKKYGVHFATMDISDLPYDPIATLKAANEIKSLQGPTVVYTFYMQPDPMPTGLQGLILSYLTNLPSLPIHTFNHTRMLNGKTELIAPNIAFGPQPAPDEYLVFLHSYGIRSIAYIGLCDANTTAHDAALAQAANITFTCFQPDIDKLIPALSHDGPWYVYGPQAEMIEDKIENHFKDSIPAFMKKI